MNEYTYWMAFASAENIYTRRKNEILAKIHSMQISIADFFTASDVWAKDFGLSENEVAILRKEKEQLGNYSFAVEDLLEQGYRLIPIFSEDYPQHLKLTLKYQSPVLLYAYGNVTLLNMSSVAIVGCRKASGKSLEFADNVAKKSVGEGLVVVSGFAKGVDRQALDSAVQNGGNSIVILPQGITTFGTGFRSLYREISSGKVLVISAFRPTAGWDKGLAMARNPYIYGMAEKIYVAESDFSGGTYSGVQDGLRKKREIYVRAAEDGENNANNELIRQGALPVDMNGNYLEPAMPQQDEKARIKEILDNGEYTAKELALSLFNDDSRKTQSHVHQLLNDVGAVIVNGKKSPHKYSLRTFTDGVLF